MALSWHTPIDDERGLLCVVVYKGNYTYELIRKYGEFTLNFLSIDRLDTIWFCGTRSGRKIDKVSMLKLKLEPSIKIKTRHIADALAYIECKVVKEIDMGDSALIIAKVEYWEARKFDEIWKPEANVAMHVGSKYFCTPSSYYKVE